MADSSDDPVSKRVLTSVEIFKLCDSLAYFDKFLSKGIYEDGRPIDSFTKLTFKRGTCGGAGSGLVRQGGGTVFCSIHPSICMNHDGPLIIFEIDKSDEIDQAVVNKIKDILDEMVEKSQLFARETLACRQVEKAIELFWELTIRIQILNMDGSVLDAVLCAVVTALTDLQLPCLKVSRQEDDESEFEEKQIQILEQKHHIDFTSYPVAATFAVRKMPSDNKLVVLCDPPSYVMAMPDSSVCYLIIGENGKILQLYTRGTAVDVEILQISSSIMPNFPSDDGYIIECLFDWLSQGVTKERINALLDKAYGMKNQSPHGGIQSAPNSFGMVPNATSVPSSYQQQGYQYQQPPDNTFGSNSSRSAATTQQTQHGSGDSGWSFKSVMNWGSSTSSGQAELKRKEEEERQARIRAMQEEDERAQKEYEEEMRKIKEENERVMRGLAQEGEQMRIQHELDMTELENKRKIEQRAWEDEQLKILNASMVKMLETKGQVLQLQKEANDRQEKFFERERARNEEELQRQQQENERLCKENKEMARQREESKRAQEIEDRKHEETMKKLEKEANEERERKDREYKKQLEEEDEKRRQEYEARRAKMNEEAKKREEERQKKHKEHMEKLEKEREQRRIKHQKLMDEFARMEEEYLKRRRERARLGEEERRQFEEDIRRMREERMHKQAAYEEYLRNMNQTIATMLAIQKSDQMMQAEYNKLCDPLAGVISSINSEAGLLINWISKYSSTAGFEDQLLVRNEAIN
ncbi:hypothetical protein WR25_09748 isoform F [Diploscapter pachys]|uniref:Ribosomal RNA-processing protein 43 n=1 Tax=Diploscapter pachys TaxID=2018661 RepID=A0A2A2K386_9BILA|nr:hypothetical protein WR25_09748 isoform D [Diploscapter pachys]PAV68395.1 hypothetical protein WR25_09748 isoform E [Diploscapter pachys]PAV68396.1 hypothetical protein WR25_09748 isoform F [Diploscapter pachys]